MTPVVGSGYTLYYLDENGNPVSVALGNCVVKLPEVDARSDMLVVCDEVGDLTPEMLEHLTPRPDGQVRRVALVDLPGDEETARRWRQDLDPHRELDLPPNLCGVIELRHADLTVLNRVYDSLYEVSPAPEPRLPRQDWRDRGRQHRNRKRRAWR